MKHHIKYISLFILGGLIYLIFNQAHDHKVSVACPGSKQADINTYEFHFVKDILNNTVGY